MIGNKYKNTPVMIDPAEVCELAYKYGSLDDYRLARAICEEFARVHAGEIQDKKWYACLLYITLFNAGRLQGMREERARRKAARARTGEPEQIS